MKKKFLWITISIVAILIVIAALFIPREIHYRLSSAIDKDGILLVPTGSSYTQLVDSLSDKGFLRNLNMFMRQALARDLENSFKSGRYVLKKGMTYSSLINMLRSGRQTPVNVTFNNIRTLDRLAGNISKRLEPDSIALVNTFTNDSIIASYGYVPETFISMFIPNTYEFYWNTSPTRFLERMKKESDKFWSSRNDAVSKTGLSKEEVMTLASIVYEETKLKSEMARIAGVYMNRLRKNMPLQADPTVKFAVGDFSLKRVLNKHLKVDSPYNTYINLGLPPGPICMPSIDAINAVLNYEHHDYLYFCAKADLSGSHAFAKTLSEHNRNAQAYYNAINRLGIR